MNSYTKHSIYHIPDLVDLPIERYIINTQSILQETENVFYSKLIYALNYYFSFPFSLERKPYILAFKEKRDRPTDKSIKGLGYTEEVVINWSTYTIELAIIEVTIPKYPQGIHGPPTQNFDHVFIENNWNDLSSINLDEMVLKANSSITRGKGIFIINVAKERLWFYIYFKDSGLKYSQRGISGLVLLYPLLNLFTSENEPVINFDDYVDFGLSFTNSHSRFYIHLLFSFMSRTSEIDNLEFGIRKFSILRKIF